MGHLIASVILGVIGGLIAYALDYSNPWPLMVGVIVFLAYWGVFIIIIDADWL
jgi:F0F1-type ATP synthase assembly protein I